MRKSDKVIAESSAERRAYILSRHIVAPSGCHEFSGSISKWGYGTAKVGSECVLVHRISLFHKTGIIGELATHSCDNPRCINADHLSWGTVATNNADMMHRGRNKQPKGDSHALAKLTSSQVKEIRAIGRSMTMARIAAIYGVYYTAISKIINNKTWVQS